MTARYPAECPVFEALTDEHAPHVCRGEHVEVWPQTKNGSLDAVEGSGWLACETVRPRVWGCVGYRVGDLRPLTRAAREMLALVQVTP